MLVACVGERLLGIQASQLIAAAGWLKKEGAKNVSLAVYGPRLGVAARIAAALDPQAISACKAQDEMRSLSEILEKDMSVNQRPELFCFGLLSNFELADIQRLGNSAPEQH
jgi:hypothetical protein